MWLAAQRRPIANNSKDGTFRSAISARFRVKSGYVRRENACPLDPRERTLRSDRTNGTEPSYAAWEAVRSAICLR